MHPALLTTLLGLAFTTPTKHTFALGKDDFLLDGKPYEIVAGEMHPARIPAEYWRHRIQMAKAMGCNTVSAYVFWNHHETSEGKFDFKTGNHDLAKFIKTAQEEGMWVLLRPGPYCCAEWDLGGIPSYLLKHPDIKLRCMDPRYTAAAGRWLKNVAAVVKPLMVDNGGPALMVQLENEYGSYGNDRAYMAWVKEQWVKAGVDGPFYTGDGPTTYMLEAGSLPGCAVGLDSGSDDSHWQLANRMNPGVPVFSSETYPGWLTHWGEGWARAGTDGVVKEVDWLLKNKKSFSFYVVHGGTNFGWTAGANSGGKGYEPDVTSYDYDAPINEQGRPTPKYFALRELIGQYRPNGEALMPVPSPVPAMSVPEIGLVPQASVWDKLGRPVHTVQPKTFEALGLDHGFVLYRTKLVGHKSGRLNVTDLHDFATVFVDGVYVGNLNRRAGVMGIDLPRPISATPVLDILVEGMGRINFAQNLIDRKGITDRVTLNGMTLMNWECFPLSMDPDWIGLNVAKFPSASPDVRRPGVFVQAEFALDQAADTFIDMSNFKKGVVWVNGHNLGRYWEIGPQKRLYCPATFLRKGQNQIVVFDMLKTSGGLVAGYPTLE